MFTLFDPLKKTDQILPRENEKILIQFTKDGVERRTKGFYFTNGTKPEFASYGSEINNVIGWESLYNDGQR
jgi:hypothetical protein